MTIMQDIDRAKAKAFGGGVFSHANGGGVHVGTVRDGERGTFAAIYTRDNNGAVREWLRVMPDGRAGVGTDAPKYAFDVNGIARVRAYLMTELPAGELGCIVAGVDHRHGPGTGCLMYHNGREWEECGGKAAALPMLIPVDSPPDVSALLARLEQLEQAYSDLRHAFENHSHAHETLVDSA